MVRAKRIYILVIKVNKLFPFSLSQCFLKEIENMFAVSLSSYRNNRESLGELEKALETGRVFPQHFSFSQTSSRVSKQLDYELEISRMIVDEGTAWVNYSEESSTKSVRFEEQIMSKDKYPSLFSPQMESIVFIILQIFSAMHGVFKIGEYSRMFPSFSWGIFGHVTCLDQSRASENIWWIIIGDILRATIFLL